MGRRSQRLANTTTSRTKSTGRSHKEVTASREMDKGEVAELLALGTATLGESGATGLDSSIRPMWHGATFAGPAFTVSCAAADNLAIHQGVAVAPRGSVLAASLPDRTQRGYWGEVLTTAAETAGIVALVIDGTVRDVSALERHKFPVFRARHGTARRDEARPWFSGTANRARGRDRRHGRLRSRRR